uniref:DUF4062 domain-containing protein n=1 Tax=Solibacter usitatus (strain Ellin6076) TaxID=234267 RepID=Q028V0_SOLUE
MPENKTQLNVVLVWPSDVLAEREALEKTIITRVNKVAAGYGLDLRLAFWPKDVVPRADPIAAECVIEKDLRFGECDIVIAVLWKRFGTPVLDAQSGTEYELRLAYDGWEKRQTPRLIMHYFRTPSGEISSAEEAEQIRKVLEYKRSIQPKTLYGQYKSVSEFEEIVFGDLVRVVREWNREEQKPGQTEPPPPEIATHQGWEKQTLGNSPLYTFCGYQKELRDEDSFQNFAIERQPSFRNPNPVSHLWADSYRSSWIQARVVEAGGAHLAVSFFNGPESWPCSLAIRPIRELAVATKNRKHIRFEAQLAPDSDLAEACIAVRVVNAWYQHWAYGPGGGTYSLQKITRDPDPVTISVPLDGRWWLFPADGNHTYGPPGFDYRVIASIILEFGGPASQIPGPGKGTVLLRDVRLTR